MTLNCSHANGGVLIFTGERILIYYDGVEMQFEMSCNMPHFKGKKKGTVYLTTHRVIFNSKDCRDILQSFSIPFHCMRNLELEQPVFGANYIKGEAKAEFGGNWDGTGRFKMWFTHGGAIEFGQAMLGAGQMASRHGPMPAYMEPPAYDSYYMAPPPAYTPAPEPHYSFVPQQIFPDAPPAGSVYMMESPPPYPGIDGITGPSHNNGVDAAGGNAFYNPSTPGDVYMDQRGPPPVYEKYTQKEL